MLESGVAGFGAVKVQAFEIFPIFDGGDAFVGDVLGEIEVEFGDAVQVLDLLHALIGDVGEREIENGSRSRISIQAPEVVS